MMKQTICKSMKKMLSCISVMTVIVGMGMLASCKNNTSADLVVYGKIYTAEDNKVVEAFAVKDGKYIYVGDKAGAEAFVEEGKTEVVDYTDKGLVMPGCGNGHAHYSSGFAIQAVGTQGGSVIVEHHRLILMELIVRTEIIYECRKLTLELHIERFKHVQSSARRLTCDNPVDRKSVV